MPHAHDLEQWKDFALVLGGAAAVLLGLVFVAVSLHVEKVAAHPKLERRAVAAVFGFLGIFLACCLMLMPFEEVVFGWIALPVSAFYVVMNTVTARQAAAGSGSRMVVVLAAVSAIGALIGIGGAVSLIAGRGPGLYLLAVALLVNTVTATVASWTLMVRLAQARPERASEIS